MESTAKTLSNINPYKLFIYLGFAHKYLGKEEKIILFKRAEIKNVFFIPFIEENNRQIKILSSDGTLTDIESVARELLSLTEISNLTEIVENIEKVKTDFDIPTDAFNYESLLDHLFLIFRLKENEGKEAVIIKNEKRLRNILRFNKDKKFTTFFISDSFHYPDKNITDLDDQADKYDLLICNSDKDVSISKKFVTENNNKLTILSFRKGVSKSYLLDVKSIFDKSKIIIIIDLSDTSIFYWKEKYLELFATISNETDNIKIFFDGSPIRLNILGFNDFNQKSLRLVRKNNEIKNEWIENHPDEKFDDVETGMVANSKTKTLSFFLTKETFLKTFEVFKSDNLSLFIS